MTITALLQVGGDTGFVVVNFRTIFEALYDNMQLTFFIKICTGIFSCGLDNIKIVAYECGSLERWRCSWLLILVSKYMDTFV